MYLLENGCTVDWAPCKARSLRKPHVGTNPKYLSTKNRILFHHHHSRLSCASSRSSGSFPLASNNYPIMPLPCLIPNCYRGYAHMDMAHHSFTSTQSFISNALNVVASPTMEPRSSDCDWARHKNDQNETILSDGRTIPNT